MTVNVYDVGDLVRFTGTFTDSSGTKIDPTTVYFKYKTPSGVKTTLQYGVDPAVVKESVGVYHVDVSVTESGEWWTRWESSGTGQAATEDRIYVKVQQV